VHFVPQLPQFEPSEVVLTQLPLQSVRPKRKQLFVTGPNVWSPDTVPIGAAVVVVATAAVVVTGAVVSVIAVLVQVEATQESPEGHTFPHMPQFAGLESSS
jgi:hypothetical protein